LALFGAPGRVQAGLDVYARSGFSSSPTPSRFLDVAGYVLVNAQLGWQSESGFTVSAWVRNAFNRNYFDFLSAAPGGSGLVVGQPGDPRTFGITLGKRF
jgi:iron complex outermembrane recepter protein